MAQTLSFLFTDIEGSTPLWDRHPAAMRAATERHNALLRGAILAHHGEAFRVIGDAFCVAFAEAEPALCAAVDGQRALRTEIWGEAPIHVRMGLHSGAVEATEDEIFRGPSLARTARIMSAAHGDQILASAATVALLDGKLPPGAALRDLGDHTLRGFVRPERLYQLVVPGLRAEFPPIHTAEARRSNLPETLTRFIGRTKAVAEVRDLACRSRMVTLVGPGGTGKTRLALQAANELVQVFQDGVWLVDLAPIADTSLVAQAMATVLGARAEGGLAALAVVEAALSGKHILLMLDNCEHMVDEVARIAQQLLARLPDLHLLTTSREALSIGGETVYRVVSMTMPASEQAVLALAVHASEAGALFVERAHAVVPGFALTDKNAEAVARVCRRLDGIPLAIELAAARLTALSVDELARRVDDRFRLLTGGLRTALPRQRTLRALVDWSYDLLPPDERVVLDTLAVFAGSFSLAAAEQVCAPKTLRDSAVLDAIEHLVSKSLVIAEQSQETETRYRLLETIRHYAAEKLAESGLADAARQRHFACFLDLAKRAADGLAGPLALEWLDRLESDHDNVRAALDWAADAAPAGHAMLAGTMAEFWEIRGHFVEGWARLERAIAAHVAHDEARLVALIGAGRFAFRLDYTERSKEILREATALARELGDLPREADAASCLVDLSIGGEPIEPHANRVLEIAKSLGDETREAVALMLLGRGALTRGEVSNARKLFSESANLFDKTGGVLHAPLAVSLAGASALEQLDLIDARRLLEDALVRQRRLGYVHDVAQTLRLLSELALNERRLDEARAHCAESSRIFQALHDRHCAAHSTLNEAKLAWAEGDRATALENAKTAAASFRQLHFSNALVSALGVVARLQFAGGDREAARKALGEALREQRGLTRDRRLPMLLELVAETCAECARAAALLGGASALRERLSVPVFPVEREDHDRGCAAVRARYAPCDYDQALEAGRSLSRDDLIDIALSVLETKDCA